MVEWNGMECEGTEERKKQTNRQGKKEGREKKMMKRKRKKCGSLWDHIVLKNVTIYIYLYVV